MTFYLLRVTVTYSPFAKHSLDTWSWIHLYYGILIFLFQDHYCIDWEGPIPYQHETDIVEVPETPLPVTTSDLGILQHLYPEKVILENEYHAMDTYCNVLYFVNERIDN